MPLMFYSCKSENNLNETKIQYQCPMNCENDKSYSELGNCPVCKMDLEPKEASNQVETVGSSISPESIFNLTSKWQTQNNETIELKDLKGQVLVFVMIYTSCKAACPRLVADMRNIYKKVNNPKIKYVSYKHRPRHR